MAAQGLQGLAAQGLHGFLAAQGFCALQGEDTAAGWQGLWRATAGFEEAATPPIATAAPSAITVFLRKSRLRVDIALISKSWLLMAERWVLRSFVVKCRIRTISITRSYQEGGVGHGNASGALKPGGLRHPELHPSRRALPCLTTRPDAGHQETAFLARFISLVPHSDLSVRSSSPGFRLEAFPLVSGWSCWCWAGAALPSWCTAAFVQAFGGLTASG